MKKPSRSVLILYGVCALLWTVRAILEVVYQTYTDSVFWFALTVFCAAAWIAAFTAQMKRYNKAE